MFPGSFQVLPDLDTKDPGRGWGLGGWGSADVLSKDPALVRKCPLAA